MKDTGMQWTGLLRINHQLIGKGVDSHQHHDSEMGISENAVASRITLHKQGRHFQISNQHSDCSDEYEREKRCSSVGLC